MFRTFIWLPEMLDSVLAVQINSIIIPSRHDMQRLASLDEDEEMLTENDLPDMPSSPLREPPFELSPAQTTRTTRPEPSFQSPGSPRSPLIEPAWESFAPSPSSSSPLVEPPWDSISTRLSDSTPLLEPAWDKSPLPVSPGTPLHEPPWGSPPPFQSPLVSPLQEPAFQSPAATRSSAHIYPTQAAGQSSRPLILLHEPQFRSLTPSVSPAHRNPILVPSPTTFTSPSGNFPGPHQPMDLSDAPASFSSTSIPLARSPSPVPIPLSHSELFAVSQEFAIQPGVDTPQTELQMSRQISGIVARSGARQPDINAAHDANLITAYRYYANTLVDATREWRSHVERHAMLTRFRQQLANLVEEEPAVVGYRLKPDQL
ncbi:hypothetical protein BKA82DRAFT_4022586 [Pisolithus tinctorius]|nr:hypothetical protein BKA82DRAFT_4022586 [Pisolithus tinctorius]